MKEKLLGKNLQELKDVCKVLSLPQFAGGQIAQWLYKKRVTTFNEMTNLSLSSRQKLSENYDIGFVQPAEAAVSKDGTKKYLFPYHTGTFIEAVMIPDEERVTLCVSSQAGCRMGCKFCMTGRQGFKGNLDASEILSQFFTIPEADRLTNAVFMGMGEPLDNLENVERAIDVLTSDWGCGWSPKRITVSTIGVNVQRYLDETKTHLAVSMHNPYADERQDMMPAETTNPLDRTLEIIKQYDFTKQRRVSFEYIMFKGLNDNKRHADAIISKLRGLECRVNLIRFHDIGDTKFQSSSMAVIEQFRERLCNAGIIATIRASRGEDIFAACGMLSGLKNKNR
ncbi:MAG TPA: 23S rRNA (adenine(2503)-C(2))-methyltransferase RlmN [Candidatus Egerieousia sp.]|nr:23S rRNA (adenine(2503)-C(2))-methyltransferase RlmN [Candidatus Egerieousia sp.]HPT06280.1 23S rRNA (adenine(2503)-C(2))-methyltransferase RlmN [Candidatus Egerieousia sp.]